jgi:NAD(P)-dependent dehydrogenase (short-subunit alcohol dehydrogenase family)
MGERLAGKVAIITGGASGMGRDTALRFLQEGCKVVIGDLNEDNGAETVEMAEQQGLGDGVRFKKTDVSEESDVAALVDAAVSGFGRLDCIFNNAGIGGAFGPITETEVEEWDFTMAVLVRGVFLGMKHAGRVLKAQGEGGSIISTASIAGLGGGAGPHCYSGAKAAVANLTRAVAGEMAPFRVRVNAIAPGAIRTPLFHSGRPDKMEALARAKTPWPRLGEGRDIAAAALFLASDESEFMTGQIMVMDGGALAAGPDFWGYGADSTFLRRAGVNYGTTGRDTQVRDIASGE